MHSTSSSGDDPRRLALTPASGSVARRGPRLCGRTYREGFTIVELLIIIVIAGLLISLLLPAVQASRESARTVSCQSNLRQIGLACAVHQDVYKHLPTNGWGFQWVGDPDRGHAMNQPGGWIYNLLPFLEQESLRTIGQGSSPSHKRKELARLIATPLATFQCPSRRRSSTYPFLGVFPLRNVNPVAQVAKSDYAGNGGTVELHRVAGPTGSDQHIIRSYAWPDTTALSGVFYVRSTVGLSDIVDGSSHTYLVGEKYVKLYVDAHSRDLGDDQTMYLGDDSDIRRWTHLPPLRDAAYSGHARFGSAHAGGCYFVFGDGAVRQISFNVDRRLHQRLGARNDDLPTNAF